MANYLRKAKPGEEWIRTDLNAYNIRVEFQDARTFFGIPRLPDPVLTSEEVLEVTGYIEATTEGSFTFLFGLDVAMFPQDGPKENDMISELVQRFREQHGGNNSTRSQLIKYIFSRLAPVVYK